MKSYSKQILICLAVIPFVVLVWFIIRCKVDVPYWDQWEIVSLLEKSYKGTLSFGELFKQHNEHRPFFPLLIMLPLAHLSGWNISYELAVNVLLSIGIFLVILFQFGKTAASVDGGKAYWPIPIISLIIFSLPQAENWLWGWQMQVFFNMLAVTAGIVLLANFAQKLWGFCLALLAGIIGTYSFANGLLYWPIGLLMLLFVNHSSGRSRIVKMAVWLIISSAIAFVYAYNYHKPEGHPQLLHFAKEPLEYIKYVLMYLGSPVSRFLIYSGAPVLRLNINVAVFGLSGLAVFCCLFWVLSRSGGVKSGALVPYAAFTLYAVTSAMVTGIARVGFTRAQALSSRYVTVANLLWISNIVLLFLFSKVSSKELKNEILGIDSDALQKDEFFRICRRKISSQTFVAAVLTVIVVLMIFNSFYATMEFEGRYLRLEPARKELLGAVRDDELLKNLYPDPKEVKVRREILKKYKLSVFRE
jgi:hypothetical protein